MKAALSLTETELLILLAILRLGDKAYGIPLCHELSAVTGRTAALASVYKILDRLEKRGFVASHMGDPTPERGGRAKRFARVTSQGVRAIDATRTLLNSLWKDVPTFHAGPRKERA